MPRYSNPNTSAIGYRLIIPEVDDSLFNSLLRRVGYDRKARLERERDEVLSGVRSYFGSAFDGMATAIEVEFDTGKTYAYPANDDLIRAAEDQRGLVALIWRRYR